MMVWRIMRWCAVAALALVALPATAQAEAASFGSLREIVAEAAGQLLKLVGDSKVSVGEFTATGKRNLNGGPEIVALLAQELNRLKPKVVQLEDAPFEIKGQYLLVESPDKSEASDGQKVVRLDFQVIDTNSGQSVQVPITRLLKNNSAIIQMLGISGPLPHDPEQ